MTVGFLCEPCDRARCCLARGSTTKLCVPSLCQTRVAPQMPAALAVTVHAVVVLHPTDGETEAQSVVQLPFNPRSHRRSPGQLTGAHTTQQGLPTRSQAGADSVQPLPPGGPHWLMSSPGQPGSQVPTALKLFTAFCSR